VMRQMAQMTGSDDELLSDVTDEKTPVLVILSFTPSQDKNQPLGLGQASLEFWKPVSGGFAYAGRFAPNAVKVTGLMEAGPDKADTTPKSETPSAAKPTESAKPAPPAASNGSARGMDMNSLMPALEKSPGCFGVAAMELQSGKVAIVSWFENKKATIDWYNSEVHSRMMTMMPAPTRLPLSEVKDEKIPIIVVASLTPTRTPDPKLGMPVSQIAVELYTPAKGGYSRGGWFSPAPKATP
jgi:hypothetical protein